MTVRCDVVNISVGPPGRFDERDPLQIASSALVDAGKVVVVAAGNGGPGAGTLVAMARAPWVLTVGAVNRDGTIDRESSRGGDGVRNPDFVSLGEGLNDAWFGTSFAAPRVASAAAYAKKCLELIIGDLRLANDVPDQAWSAGVDLPWIGFVDTGWDSDAAPYRRGPVAADLLSRGQYGISLQRTETLRNWAKRFVEATGFPSSVVDSAAIRRALLLGALPAAGDVETVGAGFVSWDIVRSTFRNLTAKTVAALLDISLPEGALAELGTFWDQHRVTIAEDAFMSGVRFSVARVIE
jgi:hypothetical protein